MDPHGEDAVFEQEAAFWKPRLLDCLPNSEIMKELYQEWLRIESEDQQKIRNLLVEAIEMELSEAGGPERTLPLRQTYYLIDTFDEWSGIQDNLGACGADPSVIDVDSNLQNQIANMAIILQKTITDIVSGQEDPRELSEFSLRLASGEGVAERSIWKSTKPSKNRRRRRAKKALKQGVQSSDHQMPGENSKPELLPTTTAARGGEVESEDTKPICPNASLKSAFNLAGLGPSTGLVSPTAETSAALRAEVVNKGTGTSINTKTACTKFLWNKTKIGEVEEYANDGTDTNSSSESDISPTELAKLVERYIAVGEGRGASSSSSSEMYYTASESEYTSSSPGVVDSSGTEIGPPKPDQADVRNVSEKRSGSAAHNCGSGGAGSSC